MKRETERFVPLEDRILVELVPRETVTPGGLHIPDNAEADDLGRRGRVVAVGPGVRHHETRERLPLDVAVGDLVVISKYGGTRLTEKLTLLRVDEVLCRVVES